MRQDFKKTINFHNLLTPPSKRKKEFWHTVGHQAQLSLFSKNEGLNFHQRLPSAHVYQWVAGLPEVSKIEKDRAMA